MAEKTVNAEVYERDLKSQEKTNTNLSADVKENRENIGKLYGHINTKFSKLYYIGFGLLVSLVVNTYTANTSNDEAMDRIQKSLIKIAKIRGKL